MPQRLAAKGLVQVDYLDDRAVWPTDAQVRELLVTDPLAITAGRASV